MEKSEVFTLLGLYEAIEAVNTIEPLIFNFMNARAAARAVKKAPNRFTLNKVSISSFVKSRAAL